MGTIKKRCTEAVREDGTQNAVVAKQRACLTSIIGRTIVLAMASFPPGSLSKEEKSKKEYKTHGNGGVQ